MAVKYDLATFSAAIDAMRSLAESMLSEIHDTVEHKAWHRMIAKLEEAIMEADPITRCGVCGGLDPIACPFGCGMEACAACLADAHLTAGDTVDDPERPCPAKRPTPRPQYDGEPEDDVNL